MSLGLSNIGRFAGFFGLNVLLVGHGMLLVEEVLSKKFLSTGTKVGVFRVWAVIAARSWVTFRINGLIHPVSGWVIVTDNKLSVHSLVLGFLKTTSDKVGFSPNNLGIVSSLTSILSRHEALDVLRVEILDLSVPSINSLITHYRGISRIPGHIDVFSSVTNGG